MSTSFFNHQFPSAQSRTFGVHYLLLH